ncbi:phospho-N-acetylmuramoyl-pentapeptide-transferase [Apibacter adventoris]|uniref:Phospho-N-acetylmuramoyl-pentapeptide-transferase n=1 Tax=Apibacter adventoris TaxID=1679466 RepID=A0A2S8A764_9FLAO|nr:phospho-N-acetylmuramoyl-pentapeptide-transferase [Apibacter adventoris]PQL90404.1 phospho-N-acetylmuramoyl-pentapeptide-transferase [Apibacter adventoris]
MLYYLFEYLNEHFYIPGSGLYKYITFRALAAIFTSLFISLIIGKMIINILRKKQLGETVRELGLSGQKEKEGTPTMGGVIIILATLVPIFLFCKLDNIYIIILIISTLWMGIIGFLDDYLKIHKNNKDGLKGKFKVLGQIGLGIFVGVTLYLNKDIVIKEKIEGIHNIEYSKDFYPNEKSFKTTIPFFKNNQFDYGKILEWFGVDEKKSQDLVWIVLIPIVITIVTAVSNGANLTDGIDGLAAGSSVIIVATLALFAYVSGNIMMADYLNLMYIPNSGEIVIFSAAFAGALIGFLWYNTYPAQVFMGDTGSLTIGGVIAVLAIVLRKELLIPVLCGIFLVENLSVIVQVSYFKYTKKKYGEGRRIFLMSPLHHHFQKLGYHESKIVTRFWIIGIMLALFCIITLKIR